MIINEVEKIVGITKKNIRFYEDQGLLHPGRNSVNDYREYSDEDVELLFKIKLLRKLNVPIEEIRRVLNGQLTLSDCLERHKIYLQHETRNLETMTEMCDKIRDENSSFENLDTKTALENMEKLEREGVHFLNIKNTDVRKKKWGAALSAVVMIALVLLWDIVMFQTSKSDPMPTSVLLLITILPTAVIVGVVIALIQRFKEINGGEEDDASNY